MAFEMLSQLPVAEVTHDLHNNIGFLLCSKTSVQRIQLTDRQEPLNQAIFYELSDFFLFSVQVN